MDRVVDRRWQLRGETKLPRGTLLLVELVAEQYESGEFCEVAHAIDAGMLGGQDIRRVRHAASSHGERASRTNLSTAHSDTLMTRMMR